MTSELYITLMSDHTSSTVSKPVSILAERQHMLRKSTMKSNQGGQGIKETALWNQIKETWYLHTGETKIAWRFNWDIQDTYWNRKNWLWISRCCQLDQRTFIEIIQAKMSHNITTELLQHPDHQWMEQTPAVCHWSNICQRIQKPAGQAVVLNSDGMTGQTTGQRPSGRPPAPSSG